MLKILVAPSILSADFANMADAVKNLEVWQADLVHCDVMDGVFVPNITFGMPMVEAIRRNTSLPLDVHLMITRPEKYVERFIKAGADIVTFHASECLDTAKTLNEIRALGKKCGLVINPNVPVDSIKPYIDMVDIVMLMGVYPGFGGQKFIPEVLDKITELKALVGDRQVAIELDGGVTAENVGEIVKRGVSIVVAGSSVFGAKNPAEAVRLIHESFQ